MNFNIFDVLESIHLVFYFISTFPQPYTLSAACQILDTLDEAKIQTAILEKIKSLIDNDLDCSVSRTF